MFLGKLRWMFLNSKESNICVLKQGCPLRYFQRQSRIKHKNQIKWNLPCTANYTKCKGGICLLDSCEFSYFTLQLIATSSSGFQAMMKN